MQHEDHFRVLLRDTVNLSQFKLDTLDDRVAKIYRALKADPDIGSRVSGMSKQGSWAHETIIDPVGKNEFDADFMLYLDSDPAWTPRNYLNGVKSALGRSQHYRDMPVERKRRCVRVRYANSCHIDIVPAIREFDQEFVPFYTDDTWERTDPEGFTAWMRDKDGIAGGNLRRVIRLMKFLRDHRGSFTGTRSVILTALLGQQVESINKYADPGYYKNVPTTLLHVVSDLDTYLWANPTAPPIQDPSGSGATFNHRLPPETYSQLRDRIHKHAADMNEAYHCTDRAASVAKWKALFGEGFKAPEVSETSKPFGVPDVAKTSPSLSGRAG